MQQRLFEITYLLTEHGSMTAAQLAERFGVSRRTIYRDIDALSSAGIPVYAEKGRDGGIRMLPDYVLDRTLFTKDEQQLLLSQLQSLAVLETPDSQKAYDKLAALFGHRENWLDIDFAPWQQGEEARGLFRQLREAIWNMREVTFAYTGGRGDTTSRRVQPLRVLFRGQGWYLQAFCLERQDFRVFKLTRIHNCTVTSQTFTPPAQVPPADSLRLPSAKTVEVHLVYDASAAFIAYDNYAPEQITRLPDGRLEVYCDMYDDSWLVPMLLSHGDDMEVIGPERIRGQVLALLEKINDKYQK